MKSVKQYLVAACAIAAVSAGAYAADSTPATGAAAGAQQWHGGPRHHGHGHGPFEEALKQLNLTAAQQQAIHSAFDAAKPQMESLHQQLRTNGEALQTTPPDEGGYASLVATEKQLAAQGVQQRADLHTQIYALLTPQQKAQLPQVLAAIKAKHEQRREEWKNHAAQAPASS